MQEKTLCKKRHYKIQANIRPDQQDKTRQDKAKRDEIRQERHDM